MLATNRGPGMLFAFLSLGVFGQSSADPAPDNADMSSYIFAGSNISDEPSILKKCNEGYSAFRYIEILGGYPIGLIRVENVDGTPNLTRRNFTNHTDPEKSESILSSQQWQEIVTAFETSDFWSLDGNPSVWMPDSLSWFFEACHHGSFHALRLYPHRDFAMNDVAQFLIEIAK